MRATAYRALDIATLGRGISRTINGHVVRLAPEVARYYPPVYEPETHAFLERHAAPGTIVIDGGAHIGLFTVLGAHAVGPAGHVLSFEPTPNNFRLLQRTVALNGLGGVVDCRREALSATQGHVDFFVDAHEVSNANSLLRRDESVAALSVPSVTIDDLAREHAERISCIKIDVEGAELDVLAGASATLASQHPALALDIHPDQLRMLGGSVEAIWDLLSGHGYVPTVGGVPVGREDTAARTAIFEMHALAA